MECDIYRIWSDAAGRNAAPLGITDLLCGEDGVECTMGEFFGFALFGAVLAGAGMAVDRLTGALYQQNRSEVLVNFTRPATPYFSGRYLLRNVNGQDLPAPTWTTPNGKCEIQAISGWVELDRSGRWRSLIIHQRVCSTATGAPAESQAHGVYSFNDEGILLESAGATNAAVFDGDFLKLTVIGVGPFEGQTAVYALGKPRERKCERVRERW